MVTWSLLPFAVCLARDSLIVGDSRGNGVVVRRVALYLVNGLNPGVSVVLSSVIVRVSVVLKRTVGERD